MKQVEEGNRVNCAFKEKERCIQVGLCCFAVLFEIMAGGYLDKPVFEISVVDRKKFGRR
jgi:hypothetical protein